MSNCLDVLRDQRKEKEFHRPKPNVFGVLFEKRNEVEGSKEDNRGTRTYSDIASFEEKFPTRTFEIDQGEPRSTTELVLLHHGEEKRQSDLQMT